jgi:hypothetical protein
VAATPVAPEEALTLWLVGTRARRDQARQRIVELADSVDFARLSSHLQRQRLLALVGSRLIQIYDRAPDSFVDEVKRQTLHGECHQLLFGHEARRFAHLLEDRDIATVPLKGPLLAERIYANPGLRGASSDLDYLVRAERLDEAVETIRALGYELRDDDIWADGLPHYHYGLVPADPAMPKIELHWRVHWYETRFAPAMIERSELDSDGVRVASPRDELASLLLIYARDGFVGLRFAADIASWWDAYWARDTEPVSLEPLGEKYPSLRPALTSAVEVTERTLGIPGNELGFSAGRRPVRRKLAGRLANWRMHGTERQIARDITLIDLLLTPRGAYRVFWRHYFLQPTSKYVREYGWPAEQRGRNQVRRAAHIAARVFKSGAAYTSAAWSKRHGHAELALRSPGDTAGTHGDTF